MLRAVPRLLPLALVAVAAGCGGSSSGTPPQTPAIARSESKPAPQQFLRVQAARRHVDLMLIASYGGSNNGFNFDDYSRGELVFRVPVGWRVTVHCVNKGALRNSCVVVSGPNASSPAFPGATTPDPVSGLSGGASAAFSFTASRAGTYRITSAVSGHEQARMYVVLEIVPGGTPSVSARPGP